MIVREIPGGDRRRRDLALRLPGRRPSRRRGRRAPGPRRRGLVRARAWSASSSATGSAEPPAFAGGTVRSQVQIADPRAESGDPQAAARADPAQRAAGLAVAAEPGAGCRADGPRGLRARLRRDDGPDGRRRALPLRRARTSSGARGRRQPGCCWRGRDGERAAAGAIAVSQRRLPPLLPRRYRRRGPRGFADEEPVRGDDRARGRAGPAAQPRRRRRAGRLAGPLQAGFANAERPFRTHEIVCDPAAYEELVGRAGRAEGFFPAYRASA